MAAKSAEELATRLRRDINSLSDENRGVRGRAIRNLERALLAKGKGKTKKSIITECFNIHIVEALSSVIADAVESNREGACGLLVQLVETGTLRNAYPTLQCCLPIMLRRLGKFPFEEPSEEVRLAIVQLLHELIKAKSCRKAKKPKTKTESTSTDVGEGDVPAPAAEPEAGAKVVPKKSRAVPMEPHIGEICQVLATSLRDKFPDVKKVAASALDDVCKLFPHHMHLHFGLFLDPLLANLQHARNAIRRAALVSLGNLICCGSEQLPKIFREKVIPAMYTVLQDQTPLVRKQQVGVVSNWLRARHVCMPGDAEMEATVFSIVLAAVGDETEEVAQLAIQSIQDVAESWFQEPKGGGAKEPTAVSGDSGNTGEEEPVAETQPTSGDKAGGSATVDLPPSILTSEHLPKPFKELPTEASQRLVCSLLTRILPPVLHSLSDWKVSRRLSTVAMLQAIFVFGNRKIAQHLRNVLQAVVLQIGDDEKAMSEALCTCAESLGGCVEPESLLAVLLPWVRCAFLEDEPVQAQKNTLLTLSSCVDGMPEGAVVPHLEAIASSLCHPAVINCEEPDVHFQVTEVVLSVLDKAGRLDASAREAKGQPFFFDLLRTLLNLAAIGDDDVRSQALEGIESLAEMLDMDSPQTLYRLHIEKLLEIAMASYETWQTRTSPGFGFFESLLRQCDASIVSQCISPVLMDVLEHASGTKRDPTLRMQILALIETMVSSGDNNPVAVAMASHGERLLTRILVPNLTWKVGRVEGTIRKLSVACLITVLKHGAVSRDQLLACLAQLVPTLTSTLSDDYDTSMRHLSCIALERVLNIVRGHVGASFASDLYPELLKRLDDSSDDVRKAIAPCLSSFFLVATPETYGTTLREYSLDMLLVHLDDQDKGIQEAVLAVLLTMMEALDDDFLTLMQKKATGARAQHRSPKYCDQLLSKTEEIQGRVAGVKSE